MPFQQRHRAGHRRARRHRRGARRDARRRRSGRRGAGRRRLRAEHLRLGARSCAAASPACSRRRWSTSASRPSSSASPRSASAGARTRCTVEVSRRPARRTTCARRRTVHIAVRTADGTPPPAGSEVAVAAVDEGLLELHAEQELESARGDDGPARLRRAHGDRADGGDRQAPLRPQGAAARRRRRPADDARAVRHAAALAGPRAARRRRQRRGARCRSTIRSPASASPRSPPAASASSAPARPRSARRRISCCSPACRRWSARATAAGAVHRAQHHRPAARR